ncbi:MAG TPA: universal stress protein [Solirubrobacteraceae bacterium]|nr:universal stress protein [Solirubrobacteraceae bacterium]
MPVLICYDGSPSAQRALSVAASSLDGAPMVLLNIWNPPQRVLADSFGLSESDHGPTYRELEDLATRRAAEILAEGEAEAQLRGFPVTTRQECNRSSIWQTILAVADEVDASLIVAGTHGSTAVQSGLLGSVSNALVHHAHRPVLLVPKPDPTTV